jgi:hypothetical protein
MKPSEEEANTPNKTKATKYQVEHMKFGILLVARAGGIPLLYEVMQNAFKRLWYVVPHYTDLSLSDLEQG